MTIILASIAVTVFIMLLSFLVAILRWSDQFDDRRRSESERWVRQKNFEMRNEIIRDRLICRGIRSGKYPIVESDGQAVYPHRHATLEATK